MIYKAGHKYIDLERVTAIEPIIETTRWHRDDNGQLQCEHLDPPIINGAKLECQLHEHPIEIYFHWNWHDPAAKKPSEQFDDLMAAWRSVVEKRQPSATPWKRTLPPLPPPTEEEWERIQINRRVQNLTSGGPTGKCPLCHTFHNSNEVCPPTIPHQI